MPANSSPSEAIEVIGSSFTSIGVMVLLVTIGMIGLVCCKKRKPKMDSHMTAGNEGNYIKRGTKIITDKTFAQNNAVTIEMKDLPWVKYDKTHDLDDMTSQGEPPLNASVSSKTRLVIVEDDSDYAVIGRDAAVVNERTATSQGDHFHTVEIETFDEIDNEDDYSTIGDEDHKATKRKSASESESNKAESREKVDYVSCETGGKVNLQVEQFEDDYATIVPKSLRIKNPADVKRILLEIDDIDTPGHEVKGWPDNVTLENRTDFPETLHTTDPNSIKLSQNHFPGNINSAPMSNNTSLNPPGENDPMGSALVKLGALLGDLASNFVESSQSTPGGQAAYTLMDAGFTQPVLSTPSTDFDEEPLQQNGVFQLSL